MGEAYYFGCRNRPGHYLFDVHFRLTPYGGPKELPWKEREIDGRLCPNWRAKGKHRNGPEIEGNALLHHKEGWTALAFWDRSVDRRGACNSVFFFEGTHTFEEAVELARATFPGVWSRFTFEVIDVSEKTLS